MTRPSRRPTGELTETLQSRRHEGLPGLEPDGPPAVRPGGDGAAGAAALPADEDEAVEGEFKEV